MKNNNEIEKVLILQDRKLKELQNKVKNETAFADEEAEDLLSSLGYNLKPNQIEKTADDSNHVIFIRSFEEISQEASLSVNDDSKIEELFTKEELERNHQAIRVINNEFNSIYKLNSYDVMISSLAGIVGSLVDILLVGIPIKTPNGLSGGPLSNYVRDYFNKKFPEEEMQKLANSKISKVSFDAQDNRHTKINVEGLSAYYHRLLELGHDPLLGLVFGVTDIMNGTMTTIDKNGKFISQVMENYSDRKENDIFSAIAKLFIHYASDITTSMGLPAPMMSLFNFLQIGKIGEYDQTIAEIVQGMYFEGYDFIHFCTLSIPVMITEVITRIGYSFIRMKEGIALKDAIPFSTSREKNPKLATMLFIAHSTSAGINAGKVLFTENPMSINYPEWLAFAKYSYKQLKWTLVDKPTLRDKIISDAIYEECLDVMNNVDKTFNNISENYIVVLG